MEGGWQFLILHLVLRSGWNQWAPARAFQSTAMTSLVESFSANKNQSAKSLYVRENKSSTLPPQVQGHPQEDPPGRSLAPGQYQTMPKYILENHLQTCPGHCLSILKGSPCPGNSSHSTAVGSDQPTVQVSILLTSLPSWCSISHEVSFVKHYMPPLKSSETVWSNS